MGILVYLALIWGVWALYRRYLAPRRQKDRIRLRSLRSLLRERRRWDLELLSAEQLEECDRLLAEVDQACRERATDRKSVV